MDDGYQNEDYWNEDYQNDILSDKFSQNAEVSSESEPGSAETTPFLSLESVVLDQQGYKNAAQEYEYIGFSGIRLRRLPEKGEEREPGEKNSCSEILWSSLSFQVYSSLFAALFTSEDGKWGPFGRKPFMIFSVLLLCSLIITTATLIMACLRCFPKCADDWYKFQEKCYYYSTEKMQQNTARSFCQALGADLIVIDSENEQDFLKDELQISENTWIGLTYIEAERKWMWQDFKNHSYTNWDGRTEPISSRCCVILDPKYELKWKNTECLRRLGFICEKSRHIACALQSPFLPH
uniref:C-type lectin domain family 2 member D-like n=1 Tax=Podarcis muralis TaxID=64176 RepID=UPI0010A056F7|nr:C-type lectin domain family 2 member D-like [Podarcis muralis]